MTFDRADIYARSTVDGEFWQGEILSDIVDYRWEGPGDEHSIVEHSLAIILSPDCDLTQDHSSRGKADSQSHDLITHVLFCAISKADALRGRNTLNSTLWKDVLKNKSERYHYLSDVPTDRDLLNVGFDALAMDFRDFFCLTVEHLQNQLQLAAKRRCRLESPLAQHLAQRFFYYQCRIGLPVNHHLPTGQQSGITTSAIEQVQSKPDEGSTNHPS